MNQTKVKRPKSKRFDNQPELTVRQRHEINQRVRAHAARVARELRDQGIRCKGNCDG